MRKPFQVYTFVCLICGRTFTARKSHAETCSSTCRSIKFRQKKKSFVALNECSDQKSSYKLSGDVSAENEFNPSLIPATPTHSTGNNQFNFEIYTTCYGSLLCFNGFERALFSTARDRETICEFENYLLRRKRFYFNLTGEDRKKVECLKIILENRETIIKNIWLCEEGCNRFTGEVMIEPRTISKPQYQYHY